MAGHQHRWDYFANDLGQWTRRCQAAGCDRVEVAMDSSSLAWEARARALEQQLDEALGLLHQGNTLIADVLEETDDTNLSRVHPAALSAWQRAYDSYLARQKEARRRLH